MKNILFNLNQRRALLLFVGIICLVMNTGNAQNTKEDKIIGVWQFDAQSSFAQRDQKVKDHFTKNPALKAKVESVYIGKIIKFSNNGDYSQILANGSEAFGKWQIQGANLIIIGPNSSKYNYSYKIAGNKLLISSEQSASETFIMVPNQYFTKL